MLQESNRIEFKSTLSEKLEKEIVAFLNNQGGGILYLGLDDNGQLAERLLHEAGNIDTADADLSD